MNNVSVIKRSALLLGLLAYTSQAWAQPPTEGFAVEFQGMQSRYSGLPAPEPWIADNQFNETGLAVRWHWADNWQLEGRFSRGSELRYLVEVPAETDEALILLTRKGRTRAWSLSTGRRWWVNDYFAWVLSAGVMHRTIEPASLFDPVVAEQPLLQPLGNFSVREYSATLGVKAEYRVLRRMSISLNFTALSSGERQQGLGIAYYF